MITVSGGGAHSGVHYDARFRNRTWGGEVFHDMRNGPVRVLMENGQVCDKVIEIEYLEQPKTKVRPSIRRNE